MLRLLSIVVLVVAGCGLIAYGLHIELTIRESMQTGSGSTMRRFWVSLSPSAQEHLASWHATAWSCLAGGGALLAVSHVVAWRGGRSGGRPKR